MDIGISSYTYTWAVGIPGYPVKQPLTPVDLIDKAAEFEIDRLQIADNLPLEVYSDRELDELLGYARSKNIRLEVATKKLTLERLASFIDIAKRLDSDIIRFIIDDRNYEPDLEEIIQIIKVHTGSLKRNGIFLALENHDRLLCSQFLEILETVNHPQVMICLDTVNSLGAGEGTSHVLNMLGPHTINFHVKEFDIRRIDTKMGFIVEGKPLGKGRLPLQGILGKINPLCKSAILEQWTPIEDNNIEKTIKKEDEWAREGIKVLKKHFESVNEKG